MSGTSTSAAATLVSASASITTPPAVASSSISLAPFTSSAVFPSIGWPGGVPNGTYVCAAHNGTTTTECCKVANGTSTKIGANGSGDATGHMMCKVSAGDQHGLWGQCVTSHQAGDGLGGNSSECISWVEWENAHPSPSPKSHATPVKAHMMSRAAVVGLVVAAAVAVL